MNYFQTFSKITQESGVRGMFKGFLPTALREMPSWAVYFWSYDLYKRKMGVNKESGISRNEYIIQVMCGGMAGVSCWLVCYPFDIIKV
jgi:solute carrier family 25 (mitochondrial carnitine/acylcarnitine transporter), member 20/29